MVAKSESAVENGGDHIPLFIGFQDVSSIQVGVWWCMILQPSTVIMKYHFLEKEKPWYNEQRHSILGQTSLEQQNTSRKQDRIDTENPEKYITYWFVQTWCIPRFHGLWSSSPNKRCKIWLFYTIWGYTSSVIHFQENPDFSKVMGVPPNHKIVIRHHYA